MNKKFRKQKSPKSKPAMTDEDRAAFDYHINMLIKERQEDRLIHSKYREDWEKECLDILDNMYKGTR